MVYDKNITGKGLDHFKRIEVMDIVSNANIIDKGLAYLNGIKDLTLSKKRKDN